MPTTARARTLGYDNARPLPHGRGALGSLGRGWLRRVGVAGLAGLAAVAGVSVLGLAGCARHPPARAASGVHEHSGRRVRTADAARVRADRIRPDLPRTTFEASGYDARLLPACEQGDPHACAPTWRLTLTDEGGLRVSSATLTRPFESESLVRQVDARTSATVIHASMDQHLLELEIVPQACPDPRTGEALPNLVLLRIDNQLLRGCGKGEP